ncbi:MAG: enoyl-CoA hydratase [Hyphomicrobiales bacterium]|nr:MAG: enoyl-CoA hydratase [Hyphomicrobiales bacterium]
MIRTCIGHGVLELTLDRMQRKNALTASMYEALAQGMNDARENGNVRVCLIKGEGPIFTAGNDLEEFLNNPPDSLDAPAFRFLEALSTFPKPVIAAVRGAAVGVGTTMLFHCDLVYAGENASFLLPFASLGLCPEAGSAMLAPLAFGYQRAAEALMLGDPISALIASHHGLVTQVVPDDKVDAHARAQAERLKLKPMASLIETKRLMRWSATSMLRAQMKEEAQTFIRMLREPAAREAFAAFTAKRKPDFSTL